MSFGELSLFGHFTFSSTAFDSSKYYQRDISERRVELSKQFPPIVRTGARQTGMTTLLKNLFSDYHYVTLDLPFLVEQAENDP
jgi:uncharacterized protein